MTDQQQQMVQPPDPDEVTPPPVGVQPVSGEQLVALAADTPDEEVHFRPALTRQGGQVMKDGQPLNLAYVTARYVADRLDDVVGPANWQDAYKMLSPNAVEAGIGIRVGEDGEFVWKYDVGVASNIEPEKGAYSDAFKRAAVKWGIARDLYDERDDKDAAPTQALGQPQGTIQQNVGQPQVMGAPPQPMVTEAQQAPMMPAQTAQQVMQPQGQGNFAPGDPNWLCPIHQLQKIVPAGVSRRTGRAYPAFYACAAPGCDQKGGSIPS